MFNFDIETVVTPAVKSAKTFTSMIMVDSIKTAADAVIDAQADFTRAVFAQTQKYTKTV